MKRGRDVTNKSGATKRNTLDLLRNCFGCLLMNSMHKKQASAILERCLGDAGNLQKRKRFKMLYNYKTICKKQTDFKLSNSGPVEAMAWS